MRGIAPTGFVFLVLCLAPVPAPGQEAATTPLRWGDVVRRLDALPRVQEAALRVRAAEAGVAEARQVPNPEAEVRVGRGMPKDDGSAGLEWGVGLTVPLDWIGSRSAEVRAARSGVDASRQEGVEARRELLGRLAMRFWEVAHDVAQVEALRETEAQAARLANLVRLRVDKGEARPTELPRIETDLERVRSDLDAAQADLRADRGALAAALSLPDASLPPVETDEAGPPEPLSREEALARVDGSHPRLAAGQARVRARVAAVDAERARRIPGLSVGAYFDRELDQDAAGGVVSVRIPVWNWNSGAIGRAEAERAAEERAAEALAGDLRAEAGAAWERCVQGRRATARYDAEILPRAAGAARAVERGFELGEVSLIDVLDARRVLLDARKERIEAGRRARNACTALSVLTGEIDDAK